MIAVFADTFYFLALLSPTDKAHQRALALTQTIAGRLVTTGWVLTELGDALWRPPGRDRAGQFIEQWRARSDVRTFPADEALFDAGFHLYRQRPDNLGVIRRGSAP